MMKIRTIGLLALALSVLTAAEPEGKMLTIKERRIITDAPGATSSAEGFFSPRAKERLLQLDRTTPFALPKNAIPSGTVDTITIVALRVDFAYEDPDDPLTTGRGTFDLRSIEEFIQQEGHGLDPAPHNRAYFEAHLRSLAQYWKVVSRGKLQLMFEVWPNTADSAYHLDSSMGYYGSQSPNYGLGAFFHDAVRAAYAVDSANLHFRDDGGRKKAVMIFHAGADRQTDLSFSYTPTPSDLYTGFATFDSANWVALDHDTIVEGVIMPETMTQDNRITVLNAVMAHEFGHQLGLVDLYNTGSSPLITEVGDFALMDNNGMNTAAFFDVYGVGVFGTVPIYASAWSRAFLGFDEVVEYREGTSLELAAVKMQSDGVHIAKVPISATEYYLLENRRGDVDGEVDGLRQDSTTDVILWPVKIDQVGDSLKAVPEYDLYLPGNSAGIAIWHVDEGAAALDYFPFDNFPNNFEANTLQWDYKRRFISIVEADGYVNFGGNYYAGYGDPKDLYYAGNNTRFADGTNPATIGNDGGYTHIDISNVSPPGMIMTFDLARGRMASNYPRRLGLPRDPGLSPVAADLDGDGDDEIVAVSGRKILAMRADGRDFLDTLDQWNDLDTIYSALHVNTDVNGGLPVEFSTASMPVFADVPRDITTSPVVGTFHDTTLVLVGTTHSQVFAYRPCDSCGGLPLDGRAQQSWNTPQSNTGQVIALVADDSLIHAIDTGGFFQSYVWRTGQRMGRWYFRERPIGICRYNRGLGILIERPTLSVSVLIMTGSNYFTEVGDSLVIDSVVIGETGFYPPLAADVDLDGNDEVILLSDEGHLLAYRFLPTAIEPYLPLDIRTGDKAWAGPVLGDFSETGFVDVIVPGAGRLYGYDRNGLTALDFPVVLDVARPDQVVMTAPIVSDITGDGHPDLTMAALDSLPHAREVQINYLDSTTSPDTIFVRSKDTTYYYYNYFSNLYVVSPGSQRVEGFPVPAGLHGVRPSGENIVGGSVPVHLKTGDDGLLISVGADGWLNAWQCGWSDGGGLWPMAGRTATGERWLPVSAVGPETPLAEFLPEKRFFGYPNPATGNSATIHYYVNAPAHVTVTIYDALGDRITEMSRDVSDGNREDEITWNLNGIASGVYHCRIEAEALSGGQTTVLIKPIAVVK
ncbi:MAG: T9SS type A sorting domain-containing protein [candidate division Zixibacteria bacterium]|nr:T9SS type A sorting domain-containing protein [candidate division Zixibacteria bacterium]